MRWFVRAAGRWDTTFVVDLLLLLVAAPCLYFPQRFPSWLPYVALVILAAGWIWRRLRLGLWYRRTPADWPLFFLFGIMLPVSIWAAPGPLRVEYSIPRAYILIWNFCLFWLIVTHSSRAPRLARLCLIGFMLITTAIALVAPLGMDWLYKFSLLQPILARIPSPLIGVFHGAESGFHPNEVAGTLLYALPLMLALSAARIWALRRPKARTPAWWIGSMLLLMATALVSIVMVLTQSRSGLLGLLVGVSVMSLLPWRWGRRTLLAGLIGLLIALPLLPPGIVNVISDAPPAAALGGTSSLGFREQVWGAAVMALHDFPFTGMGLGTFRKLVRLLYPINVAPDYDIAHAHNFFLQTGLDFGLPGLIALLAMYLVTCAWLVNAFANPAATRQSQVWVIGFAGCLVASTTYGQLDAVAMGAKTNFLFWYLFALVLGSLGQFRLERA